MFGIGPTELMVVMVLCLVLFGHRLPSVMRSLGQSVVAFRAGVTDPTDLRENA